jgi:hypothetical protein
MALEQVAFYQASTNFTQLNLSDVLQDPKLVAQVALPGYSAMFITTLLTGEGDGASRDDY